MIGHNLKRIRTSRTKLSQQDVADSLGIERNTYARWEANENDVKAEYIPKLANLLGVQIHELFETNNPLSINNIGNEYNDNSTLNGTVIIVTDKSVIEGMLKVLNNQGINKNDFTK